MSRQIRTSWRPPLAIGQLVVGNSEALDDVEIVLGLP
jgi:hypothetical protein